MEELLDQADALAHQAYMGGEQPLPNFPIPSSLSKLVTPKQLELRDDPWKGRGWFATTDIEVGQLVLLAKPIAKVMDWQEYDEGDHDEDEDNDDVEPLMNELLLIETLQTIVKDPSIWHTKLSTLYPRNDSDLSTLPAWVCHNDDVFIQVETLLAQLEELNDETKDSSSLLLLPVKDIATRLPLIVRYNVLSIETCAELLSYPSPKLGHSILAGIGLYHEPSFFNHSKQPNINRWCVGDIMAFVSNQKIPAGNELCISYIEHDVLCESADRRNLMLSMDFLDTDDVEINIGKDSAATTANGASNGANTQHDDSLEGVENVDATNSLVSGSQPQQQQHPLSNSGPEAPVVDSDVQNELMAMDPLERLRAIDELMLQAKGLKLPADATNDDQVNISNSSHNNFNESGSTMDMTESLPSVSNDNINGSNHNNHVITTPWFQCDVHNLRILKAITYDGLDRSHEAYQEWKESIQFILMHLPPNDESLVVLHVQAALCAHHCIFKEDELLSKNENNGGDSQNHIMLSIAKEHAKQAEVTHNILFGGGIPLLRRRFKNEFQLTLRPTITTTTTDSVDILWPLP